MTGPSLAAALEVHPRTIQRDFGALTEAGLPVITHRGPAGGVELGFNYRTRLTGLSEDEAEALTIWLSSPPPTVRALGLDHAARRERTKFLESLPDRSWAIAATASLRFPLQGKADPPEDLRIAAIAQAIRLGRTVTVTMRSSTPIRLHPRQLGFGPDGWWVSGPPLAGPVPQSGWGDINISRLPVDITSGPA